MGVTVHKAKLLLASLVASLLCWSRLAVARRSAHGEPRRHEARHRASPSSTDHPQRPTQAGGSPRRRASSSQFCGQGVDDRRAPTQHAPIRITTEHARARDPGGDRRRSVRGARGQHGRERACGRCSRSGHRRHVRPDRQRRHRQRGTTSRQRASCGSVRTARTLPRLQPAAGRRRS